MKVSIKKGFLHGKINAPPSKSFAHRLIIGAALADGESIIENVAFNEDILATLDCIRALGVDFTAECDRVIIGGKTNSSAIFKCRESGSTLRFMIPIALSFNDKCVFEGSERLISRGIGVYRELFENKGIDFEFDKTKINAYGKLTPGSYKLRGDISSQFITGMLFALPLLDGDSILEIIPPIESKSYIDITLSVLKDFGIEITELSSAVYKIKGNQVYKAGIFTVEGDYSNAAFLQAFNTLGSDIEISGLNPDSTQGDRICFDYLEALKGGAPTLDLSDCPDLAPVLFAVATYYSGATFTGTRRLAIKESNRAEAMAEELSKFGVDLTVNKNSVIIPKSELHCPKEALHGHNDHRIVMALTVLGSRFGVTVEDAQAVNKSYPDFFAALTKLGLEADYES